MAPNNHANNFVGVATAACNKKSYPADTAAWALYLHDGDLHSGVASGHPSKPSRGQGFTRQDGSRGFLPGKSGTGEHSPLWPQRGERSIPRGTPVTTILDMEARTLAFAIGDGEPQLAFTKLPAEVCPYICSGDKEDRSLIVVCGAPSETSDSAGVAAGA